MNKALKFCIGGIKLFATALVTLGAMDSSFKFFSKVEEKIEKTVEDFKKK